MKINDLLYPIMASIILCALGIPIIMYYGFGIQFLRLT